MVTWLDAPACLFSMTSQIRISWSDPVLWLSFAILYRRSMFPLVRVRSIMEWRSAFAPLRVASSQLWTVFLTAPSVPSSGAAGTGRPEPVPSSLGRGRGPP